MYMCRKLDSKKNISFKKKKRIKRCQCEDGDLICFQSQSVVFYPRKMDLSGINVQNEFLYTETSQVRLFCS